jgi:hypothetical protein
VDPSTPEHGKIDLTGAAKFASRLAAALGTIQIGIEPRPQLQEVVDPEGGAAGRGQGKGVRRREIGQSGGQRQQAAMGIMVEDPIFTPVEAAGDEDVFGTSEGVETDARSGSGLCHRQTVVHGSAGRTH